MNDNEIVHRIGELAEQEHSLERAHAGEELSARGAGAAAPNRGHLGPVLGPAAPAPRSALGVGADPDEVSVTAGRRRRGLPAVS
jgi:hypothetical protein